MSRPEVLAVHKACYSRLHSYSRLKKRVMMMSLGSPPWGSFLRPQYPTARETECLRHWDRQRDHDHSKSPALILHLTSTSHPQSNITLSQSIKHLPLFLKPLPLTLNQNVYHSPSVKHLSLTLNQTSTSHPQSKPVPLILNTLTLNQTSSHPQSNLHLSPPIKHIPLILKPLTLNQTSSSHPQSNILSPSINPLPLTFNKNIYNCSQLNESSAIFFSQASSTPKRPLVQWSSCLARKLPPW